MSYLFAAVGIGLLLYVVVPRLRSRSSGAPRRSPILVYTGSDLRAYSCAPSPTGVIAYTEAGKVEYPYNVVQRRDVDGKPVYFVPGDAQALYEHNAFMIGRQAIVFRELFKSGGDIIYLLQIAAAALPILFAIWYGMQFSSLQSSVNELAVKTQVVSDSVSRLVPASALPVPTAPAEVK